LQCEHFSCGERTIALTINLRVPRNTFAGVGSLMSLPDLVAGPGRRVFVLVAQSFRRGPHYEPFTESLRAAGCKVFDGAPVHGEPEVQMIDARAQTARQARAAIVIGIGGGSTLDAAKAVAMLLRNPGSVEDYQLGRREINLDAAPCFAAPTTAGTGSEGNSVSVVTNPQKKIKKAIRHAGMVPAAAILDPRLCETLPPETTALTAMDALSHALESLVSTNSNDLTRGYSLHALRLIGQSVRAAVHNGSDMEARQKMLIASYMAGISLNGGVGAMHLLAQPVSVVTGFPHSRAIATLMHEVIRYNLKACTELYAQAAASMGAEDILEAIQSLLDDIALGDPTGGRELTDEEADQIMESVASSTSHNYSTNPQPVDEVEARKLLMRAFNERT